MVARVSITVNTAKLAVFIEKLGENASTTVDETAIEIQARASQLAPRDTGSLAESIYVNNGEESDYPARAGRARALNPGVVILEEIRPEFVVSLFGSDDSGHTAVVGVAASHGIFQEYGTRFMRAQPFMTPSVEPMRDEFVSAMTQTVRDAAP